MIRIFRWISKSFRNRTKSVDESFDRYESSYPRVYESRLEDRRVLNAAAVIGVADLGSLRFDAGSQANDGGMDTFELSRISTSHDGKEIAVTINDRMVWQGSANQIGAIRFEGSSDVDQFLIDPSIQVCTGIFIDGGQFPLGARDHLVLAAASDRVFQEIVYHTNEHSVQLRFLESSSQPASTLHVQNVGDIDDRSAALNRHFDFSSTNPAWQLSGSATADGSTVTASRSLHLSNSEMGFRFESPSSNLTFDYRSSTSSESTFVLKDIQLNELDRFEWLGRDSDTFLTSGEIELGRSLFVQSGSIQMNGSMHGNHSSIVLDANRMLNISSAAEIRDAGGTFTATSPVLSHSGRVDMGAAGVITMDAGQGVLTMDGLLLSRGDDEHSGGSIFLLGDTVRALNHSVVDVSGGKGGGQILVGGDERGSNPIIRNATQTSIATQAVLNADARILGNGGKIVVWANDTAVVDGSGNIRARGGALGGNGGWIETSGKRMLFVKDAPNASAANGLAGTWLLDPRNIEIVNAYPDSLAADTSYFLVETINTALGLGTNTTLDTAVLPGDFEGNITINAAIIAAPATSTTLTLNANNNITFNAGVTGNAGTSMLSLMATAGNDVDVSSVTLSQLQSLGIIASGDVSLSTVTAGGTGQSISVTSGASKSIHLKGDLQTSGASVSLAGGTLLVDGSLARQITTGSNDAVNGGTVDLSGITTIDGATSIASLEIDTRGTSTAGSVSLGNIIASNQGLNRVLIETNSTTAGQVTLGDVRLVTKGALAPSLVVQSGGTTILANGTIDLSTSGSGETGGSVDLGASLVAPVNASNTLTILTSNSHATGGDGGTVTLGGVSDNGADYFDRITIDTSATNPSGNAGVIGFSDVTNPSLAVDGTSGTGITLIGKLNNAAGGVMSLLTNPDGASQDSSAINLTRTVLTSTGGLLLDTSGATNSQLAGDVLVGDIGVNTSSRPTSFSVDTRGTTQGSLVLDNSATGAAELHVNGPLDLSNTITKLADDALIRTYGNTNSLSLGSTLTSGGAHDLQLSSDGDISVGQINLTGGNLTVTIDNNNDLPVASFQSSGTISAGSVSISGNGANDNVTIGNTLTTTVGSIGFSNLDTVTLNGDVSATTTFGTTGTVNDLKLGSEADIDAVDTIDLTLVTNGLSLVGDNETTNKLTATGATSNVTLGTVTVTNNVSLTVSSGYKATIADIDLKGGTLDVSFGQSTNLTDASAQFQKVTAGGLVVTGNSRVNDQVQLNAEVVVGSNGILIQNYNDLDINAAVRSDGNVQLTGIGTSENHMGADIITKGGNVTMSGGTLLVDGTVDRKIATGAGSAATGGSVSLSGLTSIDGETSIASLEIDTRGTSTAGSVSLGNIVASNQGLNQVLIETNSTMAGQVTLGDVRLITKGALAPSLVVRSGGTTILANGTIDLSTSGSGETGGSVDLGASQVAPVNASSTLTIQTGNSNATGGDGGSVTLGGVSVTGADYFDRLSIDTSATNTSANAGVIGFSDVTNPSLAVDGTSGTGITLIGKLNNVASGVVSLLTNPNGAIQDSSAINLTRTVLTSTGGLLLDTSGATNSQLAGDVLVGDIGVNTSSRPTSFSVDTRGTTQGSLVLDNSATGAAELHVNGPLDLSNTITKLADDALIRTYGNTNSLSLGSTLTSGGAHDLQLSSDGDISVGQINLTGGNLTVTIDNNNDLPVASFQSSGTISAGSVSISGNGANDNVTIGNTLTTTVGSIGFSNLDTVTLNGDVSATTTFGTTGTVNDLKLGSEADIDAVDTIDLTLVTNGL
ncbi:MAG: hypothetical protein WCK15_11470, partial [Pirellula sp.]